MRGLLLAAIAATALTVASAGNAAVTLQSTSSVSTGTSYQAVTENSAIPNTVSFGSTNALAGAFTANFDFIQSYASKAVFSITAATDPISTITLLQLLDGVMTTVAGTVNGNTFTSGPLTANAFYSFRYSANLGSPTNVVGTGTFYVADVPEPATWAMMLLGFAGIGFGMRRSRKRNLNHLMQVA